MPVSQLMEAPPTSDGALCRGQRAAAADSGREALARLASVEGRSGVRWRNWARSQECRPERVFYPRTLEDLQAIVRAAAASGRRVSIAGRGHTMGPLSLTDDFLIDSVHLNRIGPVDVERRLVTVESGVSVAAGLRPVGQELEPDRRPGPAAFVDQHAGGLREDHDRERAVAGRDPDSDGHPGVQRDLVPGPGAQAPQRGARRGRLPALPAVHRECAVRDHVLRHCHRPRIP